MGTLWSENAPRKYPRYYYITRVPPESFTQDWMDRGFHDVYAEFSTCDLNVPAKTETTWIVALDSYSQLTGMAPAAAAAVVFSCYKLNLF